MPMLLFCLFVWFNVNSWATNPIIVISIDGLRPDAITSDKAITIDELKQNGISFINATTVRPSTTLSGHTSMLTGLDPSVHGLTWDDYRPDYGPVRFPTALEIAHNAGFRTAAFVAKPKLLHLNRPGSVDHFVQTGKKGQAIAAAFDEYVNKNGLPDVTFLHLPDPDSHGHVSLWMSFLYFHGVKEADRAVNSIVSLARKASGEKKPTIIITADHGGFGFGHYSDINENNNIPFIVNGENIPAGATKQDGVKVYDVAATILQLLNLPIPETWVGKPAPLYGNLSDTVVPLSLGKTPYFCLEHMKF
jgi:predicted AlkP superfamily pyrophosphatase or phosphodiesterase